MWKRYNELLVTRPLITKCITSAVLYMAGDGAGQYLDGTLARVGYQPRRTVSAGIFGGLVFAPIAHGWYNLVLNRLLPGTTIVPVLGKAALDQTLFAAFANPLYIGCVSMLNGESFEQAKNKTVTQFWPVMYANWCVWPFIQLANFKFVPPHLQVPVINVCIFGWSSFLAIKANQPTEKQQENKQPVKPSH